MRKLFKAILWLVRLLQGRDEPEAVRKRDEDEVNKAVVGGDASAVNTMLNDELERLRNKDGGGQ